MLKKIAAGTLMLGMLGFAGVAYAATDKVTICHNTGSAKNPTVMINVSVNAQNAHETNHGDASDSEECGEGQD